jgi:hypothetical protein
VVATGPFGSVKGLVGVAQHRSIGFLAGGNGHADAERYRDLASMHVDAEHLLRNLVTDDLGKFQPGR